MTAPEPELAPAPCSTRSTSGSILLDGEQRVVGWNAWMEHASGISRSSRQRRAASTRCFPDAAAAADDGDLARARARRVEPDHAFASSDGVPAAHARRPAARARHFRPTVGSRPALQCLLQIVDVTVMAGRERVLRERQNARYDAVVGSAPDAILTLDADGMIQLANPAAAREFGYAAEELIGQSMGLLLKDSGRLGQGLRAHPGRREPQPPDRAHGAAQERLVELSRGVGVELAERGPDLRHRHPARRQRAAHGGRGPAPAEPDPGTRGSRRAPPTAIACGRCRPTS